MESNCPTNSSHVWTWVPLEALLTEAWGDQPCMQSQGSERSRRRVCAECGTHETPQWRQGPSGELAATLPGLADAHLRTNNDELHIVQGQ